MGCGVTRAKKFILNGGEDSHKKRGYELKTLSKTGWGSNGGWGVDFILARERE